jgi:hypothetical protein
VNRLQRNAVLGIAASGIILAGATGERHAHFEGSLVPMPHTPMVIGTSSTLGTGPTLWGGTAVASRTGSTLVRLP